jgi:3-oxosteroid 1-dehydrogenase
MSQSERLSRRRFLGLLGAAATTAIGCSPRRPPVVTIEPASDGSTGFDEDHDVVVVGGGVIGGCAALFAHEAGAKTVIVEKAAAFGGTAARSAGVYWVPRPLSEGDARNLPSRASSLRRYARASYPARFDPNAEHFGLTELDYQLIAAVYDETSTAVRKLDEMGALSSQPAANRSGPLPDFLNDERNDVVPIDRRLRPKKRDGSFGSGDELVRQIAAGVAQRQIPVRVSHRVTAALTNADGEVVGVEAERADGTHVRIRARRAVLFATGGYTHAQELMSAFQPGPLYGGCAVPTNEGDFIYIATALGARLGHMQSAWYAQVVLEQALRSPAVPDAVFMPPGDSMILVNRLGRRVVNEKSNHNERPQVHFLWDATSRSWINQLLFMVYDRRTAELFGGRFPLPARDAGAPYVLKGDTFEQLAAAIDKRLQKLAPRTGGVTLDIDFPDRLAAAIKRFNKLAESGIDLDYDRGGRLQDRLFHAKVWSFPNRNTRWPANDKPNVTMYPFAETGPFYAILLGPGTIDTHGGPVVDANGRVLAADGAPIAGLYGAGNCIASPTGRACYGHGATLGPALAFAYLAGSHAADEREKRI